MNSSQKISLFEYSDAPNPRDSRGARVWMMVAHGWTGLALGLWLFNWHFFRAMSEIHGKATVAQVGNLGKGAIWLLLGVVVFTLLAWKRPMWWLKSWVAVLLASGAIFWGVLVLLAMNILVAFSGYC